MDGQDPLQSVNLDLLNRTAVKKGLEFTWDVEQSGSAHQVNWMATCSQNGEIKGRGSGSSQKMAKERAAKQAFIPMGWVVELSTATTEPARASSPPPLPRTLAPSSAQPSNPSAANLVDLAKFNDLGHSKQSSGQLSDTLEELSTLSLNGFQQNTVDEPGTEESNSVQGAESVLIPLSLFNETAFQKRVAVVWAPRKLGADHQAIWEVCCIIDGQEKARGLGSTQKVAKSEAASKAYIEMGWARGSTALPSPPPLDAPTLPLLQSQTSAPHSLSFITLALFNEKASQMDVKVTWSQANSGSDHSPNWEVKCYVGGEARGKGTGTSLKPARDEAARTAYLSMGWATAHSRPASVSSPQPSITPPSDSQPQTSDALRWITVALLHERASQKGLAVLWSQLSSGSAHVPMWEVKCYLNGEEKGKGAGSTVKVAKEQAARETFVAMGWA